MARIKSKEEIAAGKLISEIQKHWHKELGEPEAEQSEAVMNKAHSLLIAAKDGTLVQLLHGFTVATFLGEGWVSDKPHLNGSMQNLQEIINNLNNGA